MKNNKRFEFHEGHAAVLYAVTLIVVCWILGTLRQNGVI
jgi:hypothetical protein